MSATPATSTSTSRRPRVLVVDDSAVVRGLVARWIEADNRLEVAATCADGEQAVKRAGELQPDLVVLDVEMPRMDGLTALPLILMAIGAGLDFSALKALPAPRSPSGRPCSISSRLCSLSSCLYLCLRYMWSRTSLWTWRSMNSW